MAKHDLTYYSTASPALLHSLNLSLGFLGFFVLIESIRHVAFNVYVDELTPKRVRQIDQLSKVVFAAAFAAFTFGLNFI